MFCYVYYYLLADEFPHWYSKVVLYSLNPCMGLSQEQNPLGIPGLDEITEMEKRCHCKPDLCASDLLTITVSLSTSFHRTSGSWKHAYIILIFYFLAVMI